MIDLIEELEECEGMKTELRRQAMTYQFRAKQTVAEFYRLPFEQVDLPFNDWMALRRQYEQDSGKTL